MEPTEQEREQVQYLDKRGMPQYGNFYKAEFLPERIEGPEVVGLRSEEKKAVDPLRQVRPEHRDYYELVKPTLLQEIFYSAPTPSAPASPKNYQLTEEGKRFVEAAQQEAARRAEIPDELPNETEIDFVD